MYQNDLYHHGIKGQKWGVRRYQNPDGSLTLAGKKKVSKLNAKINNANKRAIKSFNTSKKNFEGSFLKKGVGLRNYNIATINKKMSDHYRKELRNIGVKQNESLKVRESEYEASKAFIKRYANEDLKKVLKQQALIDAGRIASQQMINQQMINQQITNQMIGII